MVLVMPEKLRPECARLKQKIVEFAVERQKRDLNNSDKIKTTKSVMNNASARPISNDRRARERCAASVI